MDWRVDYHQSPLSDRLERIQESLWFDWTSFFNKKHSWSTWVMSAFWVLLAGSFSEKLWIGPTLFFVRSKILIFPSHHHIYLDIFFLKNLCRHIFGKFLLDIFFEIPCRHKGVVYGSQQRTWLKRTASTPHLELTKLLEFGGYHVEQISVEIK